MNTTHPSFDIRELTLDDILTELATRNTDFTLVYNEDVPEGSYGIKSNLDYFAIRKSLYWGLKYLRENPDG